MGCQAARSLEDLSSVQAQTCAQVLARQQCETICNTPDADVKKQTQTKLHPATNLLGVSAMPCGFGVPIKRFLEMNRRAQERLENRCSVHSNQFMNACHVVRVAMASVRCDGGCTQKNWGSGNQV